MTEKQTLVFPRRLNQADAGFYFLGERDECNVAMVMLAVLPRAVEYQEMVDELLRAAQDVPRFLDRLEPAPGGLAPPSWVPIEGFDPRDQIHSLSLPTGSTWDDALKLVDDLQDRPFPPAGAPWEIALIRGCPDGKAMFVMKVHHALSDGTALSLLFGKAFGRAILDASGVEIEASSEPPPDSSRLGLALRDRAADTARLARGLGTHGSALLRSRVAREKERDAMQTLLKPWHRGGLASYGRRRRLSGFKVDAQRWEVAAEKRGGNSNDLYLALVSQAMRRCFPGWDLEERPLQAVMPVNVRDASGVQDGGNVTGVSVVSLDGRAEHLDDLAAVRERAREAKTEAITSGPSLVGELVQLLPGRPRAAVQYREFATRDIVVSNVPVPIPGELCGVPFEMLFMVAPAIGTAASFTLTSYGESVHLAANADADIVPASLDRHLAETLAEVFGDEVSRLRETASPAAAATPSR